MKQFCILAIFLIVISPIFSQTVDKAKEFLKSNKLTEAKNEIDNFLAIANNQKNADAFYAKAKVYNAIAMDAGLSRNFPSARMDAFLALKKYTELDDKMLISLQIDGYKPVNDMYTGYYQEAAIDFNQKKYDRSLTGFINAIMVSTFMTQKGWISLKLDTNAVLYAGVSAEKLGRLEDAVKYYGMLVEGKVTGPGFEEIYKWVANYHYEAKDYSKAAAFITIGKELYPNDAFWPSLEIDMIRQTGSRDQLFTFYEQTIAADPTKHLYMYNYAVELYQFAYNTSMEKRPANSEALIKKAQENIQRALQIKPDYVKAQLFAGQIVYNMAVDILKTNKIAALKHFDEALPYFLKVEKLLPLTKKLTNLEKSDLTEALDLLIIIYDQKKIDSKVKEYEQKLNDAKKN